MCTITLTNGSSPGSLIASASNNVIEPVEAPLINVVNQMNPQVTIYITQMALNPWLPPTSDSYPQYANVGPFGPPIPDFPVSGYKCYLGFSTAAISQPASFFQVQQDDSWFVQAPTGSPIVPLRISGCMDVALSPQTDPNPPHNVHPIINTTIDWDPTNPMMWVTNNAGGAVVCYIKLFYTTASGKPATVQAYDLPAMFSAYEFPTDDPTFQSAWYGFAFDNEYADADAYFAAHPAGDSHHTGEVPPTDDTPTG